jgi:spore germination protein GerM
MLLLALFYLIAAAGCVSPEKSDPVEKPKPPPSDKETTVELYFGTQDAYLRSETRPAPDSFAGSPVPEQAEMLIAELLKGSTAQQNTVEVLPRGVRLLGVDYVKPAKSLVVTFSAEFANAQGSAGELLAVYSVVNTLTGLEGVDKVSIRIEGGEMGHMDMLDNLTFNRELIK